MFIVPNSLGCFISVGIGRVYTTPAAASGSGPARSSQLHSCPWYTQKPGMVYMADTFQCRQSALITTSGALIPECNDLSQFRQDAGKPSIPV